MKPLVSLDLETHLIQPGLLSPPIVCGSSAVGVTGQLHDAERAVNEFEAWLTSRHTIVGANISYDFGCIAAVRPDLLDKIFDKFERGEIHDILIAQALDAIYHGYMHDGIIIDPRTDKPIKEPGGGQTKRFSQAVVVDQVLGRKNAKENDAYRLSYALLEKIPMAEWPEVARVYPVDDAVNALEVAERQLETHQNLHDLPAQCRAAWAEHLASMWGIRTDPGRVTTLRYQLEEQLVAKMAQVEKLGIFRPPDKNGKRSKDTKKLQGLVEIAYMGQPPLTATGQVSCARDVLKDCGNEDLENFADVSKIEKLLGTYVPFLEQGTVRPINVKPNILLANGRSSYDGLIQLLPRKFGVRECFCARPGTVWCSVDYSAIEMATLAQVCLWTVGHSKLAEAINAGYDAHTLFTAQMYGVPYEEAIKLVKAKDPVWVDRRQMNKAADFGYPGAMGAYKFAQSKRKEGLKLCLAARTQEVCGLEMINRWKNHEYPVPACKACVEQGEVLRKAYLAMWPEVPELFRWVDDHLSMQGDKLEQFVSKRVRGGLTLPSGANTLFSGLAGDGAKRALWRLSKECYTDRTSPLWGSRPVIFAHDEIIVEMPEERVHEASIRHAQVMVEEMQKCLPDVKVTAEPALMRFWDKSATLVKDSNGRHIPWEPSA